MFVDWKLVLRQHPQSVMERVFSPNGLYGPAGWVAFRHPCTTAYSTTPMCRIDPTSPWIITEVRWAYDRAFTETTNVGTPSSKSYRHRTS